MCSDKENLITFAPQWFPHRTIENGRGTELKGNAVKACNSSRCCKFRLAP